MLIPVNTAGAIIGKGGSNIRDMRQEFNANIQIPDSQGVERVISATTKTVSDAAKLVGRIVEILNERLRFETVGSVRLLVHKSQAGTIIGLKGSRIKELREKTGANIKVNQECCPESTDRICQIRGNVDVVVKCAHDIIEMLRTAPPKGPTFPYDPNFWDDSYEYGGYNSFDKEFGIDHGARGGRMGRGGSRGRGGRAGRYGGDDYSGRMHGSRGGMQGNYDRQSNRSTGGGGGGGNYGMQAGRGGYGGGYVEENYTEEYDENLNEYNQQAQYVENPVEVGDEHTTQVTIPTSLAGSIIGKGGNRIRQIRQDSGAIIKIDEPVPGSEDRVITITGTQEQTQNAQYLLQKSVKLYSGERF
uniref:Heterogeneous nuclear ribonucleoprotein K-like n=1 Tax=Phallusia mammillata TaxID=59560 RepID=A0A6F9DFH7_9ASCI|nr:heterogeneous nuclear ribonucleoprotein K-like [Phallusia mammillata]